jgi:hypothetical protein
MYALTQRILFKTAKRTLNTIHFGFLSFSLHPNISKVIFGKVSKGFEGFPSHFQGLKEV